MTEIQFRKLQAFFFAVFLQPQMLVVKSQFLHERDSIYVATLKSERSTQYPFLLPFVS